MTNVDPYIEAQRRIDNGECKGSIDTSLPVEAVLKGFNMMRGPSALELRDRVSDVKRCIVVAKKIEGLKQEIKLCRGQL